MGSPSFWFWSTFACILAHGFFTMLEMAMVSFNKIRLQWYISQGSRRAMWIHALLRNPSRLFGTTLLGVNVAVQVGSECSREFYEAMGLSANIAPVTQVLLVMIVAELSPMFAARRYPEHTAMLGVPLIFATSKLFFPFVWLMEGLSKILNRLLSGRSKHRELFMSRDELQRILEDHGEGAMEDEEDLSRLVGNIFSLRTKRAADVMEPLTIMQMIPSNCTIGKMRKLLKHAYYPHIPIYHNSASNVVAIAFPRDVLRYPDNHRVRDYARPPWFITDQTPVIQVLKQFRRNNQSVAIVLNNSGNAVGMLTLEDLLAEVFGQMDAKLPLQRKKRRKVIERSFSGTMTVGEFNRQLGTNLEGSEEQTLTDLINQRLGHHPEKGDIVRVGNYELKTEETSLLGARKVMIKTIV